MSHTRAVSSKATPGPWRVSAIGRRNDGSLAVMAEKSGAPGEASYSVPVAYVNLTGYVPRGKAHTATDGESDANAHLIAAAPDLLDALKRVLEYMPSVTAFQREQIRIAEAAIAKAEAQP